MKTKTAQRIILIQSTVAMLGSLYYSNYGDFVPDIIEGTLFVGPGLDPCTLCRWARIFMYPIVFLSGLTLLYKDELQWKYILPFASIGILINTYHYILQKFPITTLQTCTFDKPCDALSVDYFGFLTIPLLSWIAFGVIIGCCLVLRKSTK